MLVAVYAEDRLGEDGGSAIMAAKSRVAAKNTKLQKKTMRNFEMKKDATCICERRPRRTPVPTSF